MCIETVLRISTVLFASPLGPVHPPLIIPPAIKARYVVLAAALEKSNLPTFDACYAPQYVSVDLSSKSTKRAAHLSGIHDLVKGAKKTKIDISLKGSHAHDHVVDVSFESKGVITKATGVTTVHEVGEDTWKLVGNRWLLIKTVDSVMEVKAPPGRKK